jgi:excisionase family DNA binding protein
MTPDHQKTIERTLQSAYARTTELITSMAVPPGRNPPAYTTEMMWNSPLGKDLTAIANYVEGYQVQEDITIIVQRTVRALFGDTLNQKTSRLPRQFHKSPLGEMMYAAYARYFPPDAWMRTAEVVRLYGVKRQTIYDWVEEGKLAAYYANGIQVFLRKQIEKQHAAWLKHKNQSE